MNPVELCNQYLSALNAGDLQKVLSLFDSKAMVVSPLYGLVEAQRFYRELFEDTNRSKTTLQHVFEAENTPSVALHFHYSWTLKSGKVVDFECVDVIELTPDGKKFAKLTIIYDTAPLRADFAESHGTDS
ncbi:MAG: nuclear transport factor 2 family protein [Syntrophobacteraceae bacterium]